MFLWLHLDFRCRRVLVESVDVYVSRLGILTFLFLCQRLFLVMCDGYLLATLDGRSKLEKDHMVALFCESRDLAINYLLISTYKILVIWQSFHH